MVTKADSTETEVKMNSCLSEFSASDENTDTGKTMMTICI